MQKLTIIKVGGKVVEEADSLAQLLDNFQSVRGNKILVHGGGRSATAMAERMGIPTKMVDGRRITDEAMLEIVTMVYGGLVNKNIVAKLQARGCNALGLTGADLSIITAMKRPVREIDYGYVGDVTKVNIDELRVLLDNEVSPVVAPLTHDCHGNLLNTNADTIASELARAFSKYYDVNLLYCFEKRGVLSDPENDESLIPTLTYDNFQTMKESGAVNSGMIPKLDNGFRALKSGVKNVLITNSASFTKNYGGGTFLSFDRERE